MPAETIKIRDARWFETENEKEVWERRKASGLPTHVRPWGTLIAAMGNHWHEGCYEAVRAMAEHTFQKGYAVEFYEVQDRCYQPYDAMGVMRNSAYMRAIQEGWEYLLYVDNDVKPEPDVLVRLLQRPVAIVAPIIRYWDNEAHGLLMPTLEKGKGLALTNSFVLSFILFKTAVFTPWALVPFWQDALGASENYHFQRLAMAGHLPFVDTDVEVICVSPPHYPLDGVRRGPKSLEGAFVDG